MSMILIDPIPCPVRPLGPPFVAPLFCSIRVKIVVAHVRAPNSVVFLSLGRYHLMPPSLLLLLKLLQFLLLLQL